MKFILSIFIIFFGSLAQAQGNDEDSLPQFGAYIGNLLPNNVDDVEEIITLWGLRYSHPFTRRGYYEFGGTFGNSVGVTWHSVSGSLRMDIPVETFTGIAYIGMDYTRYEGATGQKVDKGGLHVGGGLMSLIGGRIHSRFDMKLSTNPGTSLYFSIGLVFDL